VDKIMSEEKAVELGGQRARVSTLFCDIRGFTNTAERISPVELVALLNEYFTAMTEIIFQYQGTLDKYVGDEIMAIFGAPVAIENDALAAVSAAIAIQTLNAELNEVRRSQGRTVIQLGIGIDSGEVTAGYFGSPMRMEYTVMGDRVNTASRFCGLAQAGQIIVGEETWRSIEGKVSGHHIGAVRLKGKELEVNAYAVTSLL
jgi:adenylate cyclase